METQEEGSGRCEENSLHLGNIFRCLQVLALLSVPNTDSLSFSLIKTYDSSLTRDALCI